MNRRDFIRSVLTGLGAVAATDIESVIDNLFVATKHLKSEQEIVEYIKWSMNLLVNNPASCAIITDISELEEY